MRRSFLRPAVAATIFFILMACSAIPAAATPQSEPPSGCLGGAALNGWYGILISGSTNGGSGEYYSGAINFNGACSLSGANINGGIGTAVTNTSVTGTYGQNSDGTYDLTLNLANQTSPLTFTIGVSSSGTKAVGIESDNTSSATIDIESQLTTLTGGYSTSSLTGTYSVSCSGSGVDLNYVTFDGNGNLNGVNPYDNGGGQGNNPYSGTYSVNTDGTFSGSLAGSYSQYSFTGVIDNGVTEIQYTYNQSGNGEVVGCSGRQAPAATLIGYYGMVIGGKATNGAGGEEDLSGSVYFDGSSSLTVTNLQGGINSQYGNTTATGTYAANSDNTITITMTLAGQTTPQTFIVGVSEGGNEAVGIETDGLAQATIDLQSQLVSSGNTYSTASLNGTYATTCSGAEVDLNYVTFDGQGNQTGVDPYNNGSYGDNPYIGTYTVNSDGTFSGGFSGAYANYQMTGVIDDATAEIEYTYNYIGSGGVVSCVGNSTYGPVGTNPVAAAPTFNPPPGAYNGNQTVTISSTTPNATIYYTTNGVTPTTSSLVYGSTPITVTPGTTIEAIAVATNYNNSPIAAGTYFYGSALPTAATPGFNPLPGTYNSAQNVTLLDTTPGAVIHCTTDGTPVSATSAICTTVAVSSTTTIQAIAVATGYNNSAVASGLFTITPTAATPGFNPLPGTYNSAQNVTLLDTTPGAVIHCTTDGTPVSATSAVCTTVAVNSTTTIQAIAVANGYNNSGVASGLFTITPTTATPGFNPLPGTYNSAQNVTLLDTTPGAVIHCTTNGTPVSAASPVCTTVAVSSTTTIQAIAVANGYNNSGVASGLFTITPTAATPAFNPLPGTYNSAQNVTLLDTTPGSVIHCTTNGTPVSVASPVCTTVAVSSTTTIQAIAVANGYNNSAVATGVYTITPTVATPQFNPAPGTYYSPETVTLSDATPGAVIHCTTNGTTPNVSSPVCSTLNVTTTTTIGALAIASGYNTSAVTTGVFTITGTPVVPYIQANNGAWQQAAATTVSFGSTVNLGPQPLTGGLWLWSGPNGYTSTSRQINTIPLSIGANLYIATYTNPAGFKTTQVFTITVSGSASTAINLSNYFNVDGIATVGTDPINHGFDNDGYAYNSALVGTSLTYEGQAFPLAAANTADALSSQTVAVSVGSYGQLYLVGAAVNGAQLNQPIVVTYTDRSTSTFTQSFSDWAVPASYPGEATVLKTANRITSFGTIQTGAFFVYGYTFPLTPGKTVATVKLPSNRNVVFLGMGLGNTNTLATQIVPYIQVNNGAWQQTASATVTLGGTVNLGPQPLNGGSWSWTGPNGYTSTSRQINKVPLNSGTNVFTASYTNPSGVQSTETFTLTGTFAKVGVLQVSPSCKARVGIQSCAPQDLPTSVRPLIRTER
jgi:chitobiase/beta-hexosaminidase-like protein